MLVFATNEKQGTLLWLDRRSCLRTNPRKPFSGEYGKIGRNWEIGEQKMLELNENEKIESWDVVVKTTEGRELSCIDLGIDLPDGITERVDDVLEPLYPCTWTE